MIKIRYRGADLTDPDMEEVKKEIKIIKKRFKKLQCIHHINPTTIHLRYVRQYPVLEKYVNACCYEFENYLKLKLQEEINV